MRFASALLVFVTVLSAAPTLARDRLLERVNAIRASGCDDQKGVSAPLRQVRKLDDVARRISRGAPLTEAMASSGYRARSSATLFMSNAGDDADIARTLGKRSCTQLRDASVSEMGVFRRGNDVWVVLAQPFNPVALASPSEVSERILKLANQARNSARRCGSKQLPAVPPLAMNSKLAEAGRKHARDLADHNTISHSGSDGSTPAVRVTRTGYSWRVVGENVATGPASPEEVMEGWLASPGHCENIMSPRFAEMGIGYVVDPKSAAGVYWSQVFATPKRQAPARK